MAKAHPFHSIHTHGFVRVGACTPPASVGDTVANAEATIALAQQGHDRGADLLVFPELNLTSYAIDDLHLQTVQHRATEAAIAALMAASAKLRPVLLVGAAIPRNGRLYNCAVVIARGRILGVVPKTFLPNYREYYEKRWFASGWGQTGEIMLAGHSVAFGPDLLFAATDLADFVFHPEICEDFWSPTPPLDDGRLGRRDDLLQPLRLEHHCRQGARAGDAVRVAIRPRDLRLCLFRRRAGREHDRPGVGRTGHDPRTRRYARGIE